VHMTSAVAGEVSACLVRVPTEVVKSHMQTGSPGCDTVANTVKKVVGNGGVRGLWRGFGITVFREIPFALIQVSGGGGEMEGTLRVKPTLFVTAYNEEVRSPLSGAKKTPFAPHQLPNQFPLLR